MFPPPRPEDLPGIAAAISPDLVTFDDAEQLARAFKIYLWNCALSEAFYISLHFAETLTRNALVQLLERRLGDLWFDDPLLLRLLPPYFQVEVKRAAAATSRNGLQAASRSVAADMSLGFWQQFFTKRYDRLLWPNGLGMCFPFAPTSATREDAHRLLEGARILRNRIAHHRPIYDKAPSRRHQDLLQIIGWRCPASRAYVARMSRVPSVLAARPA